MYDIRIFLENNGTVWARLNIWKNIIYSVWNNYNDLMLNLKKELEFSFEWKITNNNTSKLLNFFNIEDKNSICH